MHPLFGTCRDYIPGLEMNIPLQTQAEKHEPFKDLNTRKIREFDVKTLVKDMSPALIHLGIDKILKENVSLVQYKPVNDDYDVCDLWREVRILRSIKDNNILDFYGIVYDSRTDRNYLAFDAFTCFLSQLLSEEHQKLLLIPVIKLVMLQLFEGLKHLHDKGIVHRDITPDNIVFSENGVLKITSFRNAKRLGMCGKTVLTAEFRYQPLDVLLSSETVSTAEDIWSAGCIFAEMMLKKKLFKSVEKIQLIGDIVSILGYPGEDIFEEFIELPDFKSIVVTNPHSYNYLGKYFKDDQALDLLKGCLKYNPILRISVDECLMHPHFEDAPKPMNDTKAFGVLLNGKTYKFPVKYDF